MASTKFPPGTVEYQRSIHLIKPAGQVPERRGDLARTVGFRKKTATRPYKGWSASRLHSLCALMYEVAIVRRWTAAVPNSCISLSIM
jgi:hypothetical protein